MNSFITTFDGAKEIKYVTSRTIFMAPLFSFDVSESNIFVIICITKDLINGIFWGGKYHVASIYKSTTFLNVLKSVIIQKTPSKSYILIVLKKKD